MIIYEPRTTIEIVALNGVLEGISVSSDMEACFQYTSIEIENKVVNYLELDACSNNSSSETVLSQVGFALEYNADETVSKKVFDTGAEVEFSYTDGRLVEVVSGSITKSLTYNPDGSLDRVDFI